MITLEKFDRILINMIFYGLGDVLLSTPLLKNLFLKYGDRKQIDVISSYVDVLKYSPYYHNMIKYKHDLNISKITENYDLFITASPEYWKRGMESLKSVKCLSLGLDSSLCRDNTNCDFPHDYFDIIIEHKNVTNRNYHYIDTIFYFLEKCNIEIVDKKMDLFYPPEGIDIAHLDELNINWNNTIFTSLSSTNDSKRYSFDNSVQLVNNILNNTNCNIILTGDLNYSNLSNLIVNHINDKRLINVVCRTDIYELSYILSKCIMSITVNTFATHLSSMHNIPTLDLDHKPLFLFSFEYPYKWAPLSKNSLSLYSTNNEGCNSIRPDKVFANVIKMLYSINRTDLIS